MCDVVFPCLYVKGTFCIVGHSFSSGFLHVLDTMWRLRQLSCFKYTRVYVFVGVFLLVHVYVRVFGSFVACISVQARVAVGGIVCPICNGMCVGPLSQMACSQFQFVVIVSSGMYMSLLFASVCF